VTFNHADGPMVEAEGGAEVPRVWDLTRYAALLLSGPAAGGRGPR
jgi:hypothetical protein